MTISSIKPTLSFIKDVTTATDDDTSLATNLKANIRADFEKRYTSDVTQALQNAGTWLDPHYKTAYLTEEECLIATKIKEEMMMTLENEQGQQACASTGEGHQQQTINNRPSTTDHQQQTINVDEGDNDQPAPKKRKSHWQKNQCNLT